MKYETIKKFKAVRGIIFLCIFIGAMITQFVREGFTSKNIGLLGLFFLVIILVVVISKLMKKYK